MLYIVIAGLLVLFGVISLFVGQRALRSAATNESLSSYGRQQVQQTSRWFTWGGVVLLALFALFTVVNSVTIVDARAVAVKVAFGQYKDTLQNGAHFKEPWASTEEFSTRLQPVDLTDKDGSKGDAVSVTFSAPDEVDGVDEKSAKVAGGGKGVINAVVRWQIADNAGPNGAKALWTKYRTFDDVRDTLVVSESQQAILDVANDYTAGYASVNLAELGDKMEANLSERLTQYGIVVDSVSIKGIDLDGATSASLQKIIDNINKTAAAAEEQKAARIYNETVKLRSESGALTPQANERFCLDIVNAWNVEENGPLPATFNCGLGDSKTPVIIGNK